MWLRWCLHQNRCVSFAYFQIIKCNNWGFHRWEEFPPTCLDLGKWHQIHSWWSKCAVISWRGWPISSLGLPPTPRPRDRGISPSVLIPILLSGSVSPDTRACIAWPEYCLAWKITSVRNRTCACHSLAICVRTAFIKSPSTSGVSFLPKWFAQNCLRREKFKDLFKTMGAEAGLAGTTSFQESLNKVRII